MKYEKSRSLSFNLAKKVGKAEERFDLLGVSKIVKDTPYETKHGTVGAYDVLLGKDNDTVLIVSLQRYSTDMPVIRDGKMVDLGERKVNDIMVASHSLKELGTTFDDVVSRGLESNWIAANAMYFNSEDRFYRGDEVKNAIECIQNDTLAA